MLSSLQHLSSCKTFSLFSHSTISFIREGCVSGSLWITSIQEKKHLGPWQIFVCMHAQLLSHIRLFCSPMDCSPPGSSVHRVSHARILEWSVISFSRGPALPRDQTRIKLVFPASPAWQVDSLPLSHLGSPDKSLQDELMLEPGRCRKIIT